MLTDQQKIELENLRTECQIPSLRKILDDAIPKWLSGEITPKQHDFGVYEYYDNGKILEKFLPKHDFRCCLLGTGLIGKSTGQEWEEILHLSIEEFYTIHKAFDALIFVNKCWIIEEIYNYVAKIKICVFGK